jgi:dihydroorotate dehydrogenase electron transfer subunit
MSEYIIMDDIEATIIKNINIASNYYLLKLRLSRPMGSTKPGQFVMLKVPGNEVFLRRPFSIYAYNRNILTLMYRIAGKGTEILSNTLKKDKTFVLGPLGNAFNIRKADNYFVLAGGIGIAGVRTLIEKLGIRASIFFGCNNKEELPLIKDIRDLNPMVATLDGSYGFKGNVVELFGNHIVSAKGKDSQIFVCGPEGMVKSLRKLIEKERVPCQVLVEERMACGLGLCFGCVIKTIDEKEPYKRVCKEGPVFDLWEISL